ncbi:hypothetical protein Kalk_06735 [Ketobacter alkanivorans]|uniref:Uncharacterized protein n=1 Tax=Ketobacter alkanivorans TaxID=1917421 RepID=A0A2K9LMU8_9GAMM|nr:hypothetical protein Kalk_06735 [Ketobacter alkanivorans]
MLKALYQLRVGCPSCDLPEYCGQWNSIYNKPNSYAD